MANNLKRKNILLVNTGPQRKEFIIKKIYELGANIIILNQEKNWADYYAIDWIIADTLNHAEAMRAVEEYALGTKIKFDAILTYWEMDVLLTSKLVDKYKTAGIPHRVSYKMRNKFAFRNYCRRYGLPAPKCTKVLDSSDLQYAIDNYTFPLVIKPKYGSNSACVEKADNERELRKSYKYISKKVAKEKKKKYHEVIVEEYIEGEEVDIDILIQDGVIKFYAISDNIMKEPSFIEMGRITPSKLSKRKQDELIEMAEQVLAKLEVNNGLIHFEARSTKNGAMPVEVNLRLGGDEVYPSVLEAFGVDLIEGAVRVAMGEEIKKQDHAKPINYMMSHDFLAPYSGRLKKLNINFSYKEKDYLKGYQFFKKAGDKIVTYPEGRDYLGWVMVAGNSFQQAEDNLKEIVNYFEYKIDKAYKIKFLNYCNSILNIWQIFKNVLGKIYITIKRTA